LILLATVLLPSILTNPEFTLNFSSIIIPLIIVIILSVIGLSIFIFYNYRLFSLLEREDWPALAYYLEQQLFVKGRYSVRNVRILASSYLVISDYNSVFKLENKAFIAKPAFIEKNVLIFGAARVLGGNYTEAAAFFKTHLQKRRVKDDWVHWYCGFSNLLSSDFTQAEPEFSSLAVSSRNPIITGLSVYFLFNSLLKNSLNPETCRTVSENGRKRVIKAIKNAGNWKKKINKVENEIHVAIIRKYVQEAGKWLFSLSE
jgi:hypothetical protein